MVTCYSLLSFAQTKIMNYLRSTMKVNVNFLRCRTSTTILYYHGIGITLCMWSDLPPNLASPLHGRTQLTGFLESSPRCMESKGMGGLKDFLIQRSGHCSPKSPF